MSPDRLNAEVDQYRQAAAANTAPPDVLSDPLVGGLTPIEQLLRILGLAANFGDEQDNAEGADEHAERDLLTTDAAAEFAAQDEAATAQLAGVGGSDSSAQMAQQIPQMASGIAGSLAGALAGVVQPFAQIPQQLGQAAQQALQSGLGFAQQAGGSADLAGLDLDTDVPMDDFASGTGDVGFADEFGSPGDPGGGGFSGSSAAGSEGGGAAPAPLLGPPVPPSAATFPSSARTAAATPTAPPSHGAPPGAGMTGFPVPPAAMNGAQSADKEARTDTKRVSVPPVRNGAPVQGRLDAPAAESASTAIRRVQGKPIATRRIIVSRSDDPDGSDPAGRS